MIKTRCCAKCNGLGYIEHHEVYDTWSERCEICKGKGVLEVCIVDDIADIAKNEMVYITKKEYEELLEYKYMYESLCK